METLINPNQIRDGGSSKEIKVLNVVQNGILYRSDGTKFTDFSDSNYLTIGGVVQNGIFSQSENILSFSQFFSTADSWEFNGSFKLAGTRSYQHIIGSNSRTAGIVLNKVDYGSDTALVFQWFYGSDSIIGSIATSPNFIQLNQKYYFRLQYDNGVFRFYVNTDGQTYDNTTLIGEESGTRPYDTNMLFISHSSFGHYMNGGEIDLTDWNIKKNGEYWWKGVETL